MMQRTRLLISILVSTCMTAPAAAQVPETGFALVNARVEPLQGGLIRYEYELRNIGDRPEILDRVLIDLRSPRSGQVPQVLTQGKGFLFDALAERPNPDFSHPPVGLDGPANWWVSIYFTGAVAWRAEYIPNRVHHGVRPGDKLRGFVLTSPALPAYRKFRVTPARALPNADAPPRTDVDSTWVLREGYVIAPGWMPDQVNTEYLLEQVKGACYFRALSDCERYEGLVLRMQLAEQGSNKALMRSHLQQFRTMLSADPSTTTASKLVLNGAVSALERKYRGR